MSDYIRSPLHLDALSLLCALFGPAYPSRVDLCAEYTSALMQDISRSKRSFWSVNLPEDVACSPDEGILAQPRRPARDRQDLV